MLVGLSLRSHAIVVSAAAIVPSKAVVPRSETPRYMACSLERASSTLTSLPLRNLEACRQARQTRERCVLARGHVESLIVLGTTPGID